MRLRFVPTITLCFNPRTRVGCDFLMRRSRLLISGFNPRTRVGCDVATQTLAAPITLFQSTHPRGVRRPSTEQFLQLSRVSIHAPAWGATSDVPAPNMQALVSIHAPAWGATGGPAGPFHPRHGFNPRTRVGCDDLHLASQEQQACFNPRTRVGCDMPSRPPAGLSPRFNPRTRVGCDTSTASSRHHSREVSIHAPAWGATSAHHGACIDKQVSIHAPAWGATTACRRSHS